MRKGDKIKKNDANLKLIALVVVIALVVSVIVFAIGNGITGNVIAGNTIKDSQEWYTSYCSDIDGDRRPVENDPSFFTASGFEYNKDSENEIKSDMDFCNKDGDLVERYCRRTFVPISNLKYKFGHVITSCENGCEDGACVEDDSRSSCKDSDGGNDYFEKGTTINAPPEYRNSWTDKCLTNTGLQEGTCIENLGVHTYECPNGCSNGACISDGSSEITYEGVLNMLENCMIYGQDLNAGRDVGPGNIIPGSEDGYTSGKELCSYHGKSCLSPIIADHMVTSGFIRTSCDSQLQIGVLPNHIKRTLSVWCC